MNDIDKSLEGSLVRNKGKKTFGIVFWKYNDFLYPHCYKVRYMDGSYSFLCLSKEDLLARFDIFSNE